jgi:hypothetical protein
MATRHGKRTPRRLAIEVLSNTIFELGSDGIDRMVSRRIATEFVDQLTEHLLDTIDARARGAERVSKDRGPADPFSKKRGGGR